MKKAKKLFNEWKVKLVNDVHDPCWTMTFLQFVVVYGFFVWIECQWM